ncbi:MAG TPA: transposase, partial [Terriglobia bacterium]|nr:transposase [Terriglobia bacterium]
MLLREVEKRTGIVERFAACFTDHREAERIEHTVKELVAQRVYGLALGYEDLGSASADSPAKLKRRVRRVLTVAEKYPQAPVCLIAWANPCNSGGTTSRK